MSITTDAVDSIPHHDTEYILPKRYLVRRYLSSAFRSLGASVGRHPLWYTFVPLFVAVAFSFRIYWVSLTKDVEYLYSSTNGRAIKEREAIESIFPPTEDGVNAITLIRFRRMATLLMEAKDGGSVLRDKFIREAVHIDKFVYNITISHGGKIYTYADLCSKQYSGECQSNDILNLLGKTEDIKRRKLFIKYPAHIEYIGQRMAPYVIGFGGVTTDENDYIIDAKALRLIYILNDTSEEKDAAGFKWERSFQEEILKLELHHLRFGIATAQSINDEFSKVTEMVLPLIVITAFVMMSFAVLSCMTTNWVTSKPWVALGGCLSPVLGVATTFGFLMLCGMKYVDLNVIILFLLLGIGLDDSFVILAAWRRTDPKEAVEIRMSQTYESSAMSITITSITNILSLCVGISIPYRIVQIYCSYAATAMFLAYLYQITFFGGILALSGYREKKNRHALLCIIIKKERIPRSIFHKLFYFGYRRNKNDNGESENSNSALTKTFFLFITTTWGKCFVIATFILYLITSSYCLRFVKENFDYRDAMPFNSYLVQYFNIHNKYFTQYPHAVHIVINKTLDYSDKHVQKDVDDIIDNFCSIPGLEEKRNMINWLKYYLESTEEPLLKLSYSGYNMSRPEDFIAGLKHVFLKLPNAQLFRPHIRFNHNGTQIVASRIVLLSKDVSTYIQEKEMLIAIMNKLDHLKYPVYVYNIWFMLYGIFLEITSSTIETMCTAAATVIAVFFIFVPHLLCLVGIVLTIASIQIGVLGYMSVWGVNLNPVAMICLIMSIGLSLDYSAHISYAYLSCKERNPNEKTKIALSHAGYPIIQGCVSTILGVVVLGFGPSDVFLVFFKVVTLVMLIAAFHGILVIPVMLNVLEVTWTELHKRCTRTHKKNRASYDSNCAKKEKLFNEAEYDENVGKTIL